MHAIHQAVKFESHWPSVYEHVLNLFAIAAPTNQAALSTLTRLTSSHWFKTRYILHHLHLGDASIALGEQGKELVSRLIAAAREGISSHSQERRQEALRCAATLLIACAPFEGDEECSVLATDVCKAVNADETRCVHGVHSSSLLHWAYVPCRGDH